MHRPALALGISLLGLGLLSPAMALGEIQRGFTVASWYRGQLAAPSGDRALGELRELGVEWISLVVPAYVDDPGSTWIDWGSPKTPTDAELSHVVAVAKQLGLRVMLTLHVEPRRDGWKGQIGRGFDERDWADFFAAYRRFLTRYASLAHELRVDQLCVGNELGATTHREREWRELVGAARAAFSGPLTYAALHDEVFRLAWWDALDLIGVDAYYPLTASRTPSLAELEQAWETHAARLEALARRWGRRVLFTEVGFRSVDGAASAPFAWGDQHRAAVDLDEQALCYEATLGALSGRPWFAGSFFWSWSGRDAGGGDDDGYTPRGKPAAQVLRRHYERRESPLVAGGQRGARWQDWSWRARSGARPGAGPYGGDVLAAQLDAWGGLAWATSRAVAGDDLELLVRAVSPARLRLEVQGDGGSQQLELERVGTRWTHLRVALRVGAVRRIDLIEAAGESARVELAWLRLR